MKVNKLIRRPRWLDRTVPGIGLASLVSDWLQKTESLEQANAILDLPRWLASAFGVGREMKAQRRDCSPSFRGSSWVLLARQHPAGP